MSVLGDVRIREAIERGEIKIEPMAPDAVGSNSVDLHLSRHVACYSAMFQELDTMKDQCPFRLEIDPDEGLVLHPGELYLGSTVERTSCGRYLPMIEGTSSAGRLGLSIHSTAGVGDVGWSGHWTLELSVVRPLRVYGGEPVCQILFYEVAGYVRVPYGRKPGQNYQDQGSFPQASRMWRKPRFLGAEPSGRSPTPVAVAGTICTCPATSEYDPPCPSHGIKPIGMLGDGSHAPGEYE